MSATKTSAITAERSNVTSPDKRLAMMTTTKSVFLTTVNGIQTRSNTAVSLNLDRDDSNIVEQEPVEDDDVSSSSSTDESDSEEAEKDTEEKQEKLVTPVDLKTYEETPKWRRKNLPWTMTQDAPSDEYDTDLEEDFPPGEAI